MRILAPLLLLALVPACAAAYQWEPCAYVVRLYPVIEGRVFDGASGEPLPASVSLRLLSASRENLVEGRADENGRFRFILQRENFSYELGFSHPGYENRRLSGEIGTGEYQYVEAGLQYDPFDLVLSENSGSLSKTEGNEWGAKQVTVTVLPKNGYGNLVILSASGKDATVTVHSGAIYPPGSSAISIRPSEFWRNGKLEVTVTGADWRGRAVENAVYALGLSVVPRPSQPQPSQSPGQITQYVEVQTHDADAGERPGVRVTVDLKVRSDSPITPPLSGTTAISSKWRSYSNPYPALCHWEANTIWFDETQNIRATAEPPAGYYWYDSERKRHSTATFVSLKSQYDVYHGNPNWAHHFYFGDEGILTGMSTENRKKNFTFKKVNETLSIPLYIRGDYSKTIDTSYDSYDVGKVYRVWIEPKSVPSAPTTVTLYMQCLKWQPPTGTSFYPYCRTSGGVAYPNANQISVVGASIQVSLVQSGKGEPP